MRVLLDTNVLIAAFITHGACSELLEHCARSHTVISSAALLQELEDKLVGKFRFTRSETREVVVLLQSKLELVQPAALQAPVCRDPDDDIVLATAVAGACDCLVTGDKDLLVLKRFQNIGILAPADFWRHERI